ncbi:MAG: FkbM family methyltransferase [Anaerohalosphaeraceae bacterium]
MIPNKINQHQNDIRRIIQSFVAAEFCPNYLESHLDELISAMQTSVKDEPSIEVSKKILEAGRSLAQVRPDNWKVMWLIALAAGKLGIVELVDKACQIVLSLNKEFWFARELPKHVRGYYSQLGQDEFIERYFSERKPRGKTFVEVGAFDGRHYSNVRRLVEKYGWQGVSVEPVGKNYAKLCQSYQGYNVTCIQAAVSNHPGIADMSVSTYPHLPEWGSDVASLTAEDNDRWTKKYGAQWCKETVVVKTLTEIISESSLKHVDLLSIDAEGHDFEVLEGLDFSQYKPQLIVVEYGGERQKIISLLSAHGYSVIYDNKQDVFFADIQTIVDDYATHNYTGQTAEPYVEIQRDVEENINFYLRKDIRDSLRMVIVGAYRGDEIGRFLNRYPNLEIHAFEANPNTFQKLRLKFQNNPNVHCYNYAVSDQNGILEFYENNLAGTGSILPIEPSGQANRTVDVAKQYGMVNKEKFAIQSIRLDDFEPLKNKTIDLLWCDVQGAELHVLKGAAKTLRSCSSLLLEVWFYATLYKGQARLIDLERYLSNCGFYLAGIGLDHKIGNGSGNSFWLNQRRMNRTVINEEFCDIKDVRSRINPHLFKINYLPAQGTVKLQTINPVFLLNTRRLDVCAKVIYGRFCQFSLQSQWGEEVYLAHLKKINNYREEDGFDKQGAESFILAYKNILASMTGNGFDGRQSLIPVGNDGTIIDGSHRLAAAYICKKDVCTAVFDRSTNSYDYEYFLKRGLSRKYSDAMAYEYCRIKKNTYIVSVFPSAEGRDSEVVSIIQKYATIVYRKEIQLEKNGPLLLIKQMYQGEPWLGNWANLFKGAKYKADQCFRKSGCVRVFLVETDDLDNLKQCKSEIRHLFGIENHSVHINDSYEETLRLSQIYFNENSIHFLNHAQLNYFENFYRLLQDYAGLLDEHHVDKDCFCVDGSAVMAVYGIREARDIDYFHHGYDDVRYLNEELIGSHNLEIKYHTKTMDDIIFNPENHFYFEGIKFASLAVVNAMKLRRGEKKDIVDVNLMAPHLNHPVAIAMANTELAAKKTKIVGLVAARNEKYLIGQCLRLLSQFTDAIVYLDDCSTDDSVEIVQSLAGQCRVERILTKQQWLRDEPGDRNKMLQAGREIGGTHFIALDADEAFTSNLLNHDTLRERILSLKPGDQLLLNWICLWRSVDQYRFDKSVWTNNYKPFVFCDDGRSSYASEFIHTPRAPQNLAGRKIKIEGYEYGVLHFQFVNWSNLLLKQAWYRCIERIREPQKSIAEINKRYAPSKDETNIHLESSNPEWFRYYSNFDTAVFGLPDHWRGEQIRGWFKEYGIEYFKGLDIWDIITSQGEVRHSVTETAAISHTVLGSSSYLVSAIVSTYNSEAFIRGCLQDLVEQTLYQKGRLEIVVVNSGSQQNEEAVVKEYQSRYPHIQYIKTHERETIYAAWNRGIRAAGGRYITNANTDDRHSPQMLEKLAAVLESCPNIAYVYSQFYVTSTPHQTWQTKTPACVSTWVPEYLRETLLDRYYCGPQPMWRRSLHDEYGYFDERFKVCGDYEFVLRISQTHDLIRIAEPLGLYYKNPDSLERTAGTHDAECNFIRTLYRQFKNYTIRKPLMHPLPKFGVIIRNYNKGRYINAAIQSILAQTAQGWELIIVDDASTDDSVNTVQKYLQDTRIRLIRHHQNRGVSHAALSGIAGLSADLFGELDSDDVLTPDALEQVIKAHSDHPECGFVYTQHRVCDQDLNPIRFGFCRELPAGGTALQNDVISAFRTYKMRDYIQTAMHDSELDIAEDKDLFYKL